MLDIGGTFTRKLLGDSGIAPGMRVLDVGCGTGDVAFHINSILGDNGSVTGLDRNSAAISIARRRANDSGSGNVFFEVGDIATPPDGLGSFDVITARRVLMYQTDQVAAVRNLIPLLKTAGLMVFQEHDATLSGACVLLPLHDQVQKWIWSTVQHEGADPHTGFGLHAVLTRAGLMVEHIRAEAVVQTPGSAHPTGSIVRALLPRIIAAGIATEQDIDIDTLDARLADEREQAGATHVCELMFGAWARKGQAALQNPRFSRNDRRQGTGTRRYRHSTDPVMTADS